MHKGVSWFGYLHISGSAHMHRYHDPEDIKEAKESSFVRLIYGPYENMSKEDAVALMRKEMQTEKMRKRLIGQERV